ncbi:hypothetical protein L798_02229 [Zootermopsis nevadensis]|uniref:Uncharacterized protein n=1 Tax=Zootermopsis nevadensis TaxID=136037 RepID=A0A067RPF5_ZOONE|nr:hypothetical protein L798_02229 [Zootermopsis nevadensis]
MLRCGQITISTRYKFETDSRSSVTDTERGKLRPDRVVPGGGGMGCTPSFLHHHHHYHHQTTTTSSNSNHRNGSAEDTEVAPADSTSNSTHMTSGNCQLHW